MAKRRLNRRQEWRIRKIQDERLARAEKRQANTDALDGSLGPEQEGRVIANYGASLEVDDTRGIAHRCHLRQNLNMPVVGDRVIWRADDHGGGVVVAVVPRRSELARPDFSGQMKALAANVDQMLVVAAPQPPYAVESIDQFVVAAEVSGITPTLVFNKVDMLDAPARARVEADLEPYRTIGYRVIYASTKANHGLDDLLTALAGHTNIFVGQSGVGKSSLVQALLPEEEVLVGDLAEQTGLGRHTTSAARLYHLPTGGEVIDSPGVREFRLWAMEPAELAGGFIEFAPYLGHCRFRDCRHDGEPGCALEAAVTEGAIAAVRLESYRRLARALAEKAPAY